MEIQQFSRRGARLAVATVAAALALSASTAGPASATGTALGTKAQPAVEDCGLGKPEVRPTSLTLACADANTMGLHLSWSKWGPTQAVATGTYTWNTCVPYCAASKKWDKRAATFTLGQPAKTSSGWLFERLVVRVTGPVPDHMERVVTLSEKPLPKPKRPK